MSDTKKRIALTSIELFNKSGIGRTNMPDIAEALGMSRGNLAYHFKDKDDILTYIAGMLKDDVEQQRAQRMSIPAFANLKIDLKAYHHLQMKYAFIFENNTVLKHPAIGKIMRTWAERTIEDNRKAFAFAIELGNMKAEPYPGLYHHLAVSTWILIYYWLAQKDVRGLTSGEDAEKMVWSTIIPHFTNKGLESFTTFYGKKYLEKLGPAFNTNEADFILF